MKIRTLARAACSCATLLLAIGLVGCATSPSQGNEAPSMKAAGSDTIRNAGPLLGSWKLVSLVYEFQDGRSPVPLLGESPIGYLILTPAGRMAAILEGEGRKPAKTDEERSALLRTLISYSGKYRVEGDKWITKVDSSWNGTWNGTEQVRNYRLDGDKLFVISMWQPHSTILGNPMAHAVMQWDREK